MSPYHPATEAWAGLRVADLGTPPLPASGPLAAVVALASMHPNGHLREAAVWLLASRTDGGELPFLLVRVNDWVPQVRKTALAALRARLSPAYAESFVRCLGVVASLGTGRRAPHEALVADIESLCASASQAVSEALGSPSPAVRRAAARVAVQSRDPALLERAAMARDPLVATLGARAIAAAFTGDALREILPRLRRGASALRWIALAAVCDKLLSEAEPHLREALLDPSPSVRELGRYRWQKVGLASIDFAAFYRDVVPRARGRALATALHGLAETGSAVDAPLFEPHLRHPSADVRAAAVHGIGRRGAGQYADALLGAMSDPSPDVARTARRWARIQLGRGTVALALREKAPPRR